jgi:hypothetical protein
MHPGGPRPESHQAFPEPAQSGKRADTSAAQKDTSFKTSPEDFQENLEDSTDAGDTASEPTATDTSGESAKATSVSEADKIVEENVETSDGVDAENLVAAEKSHVSTSVAGEVAEVDVNSEYDTEEEENEGGDEVADEEMRMEENCCAPEEVPQELVGEYNDGNLIFKV